MLPVIKLIKGPVSGAFYQISGAEITLKSQENLKILFTLPEGKKWSHVAAVAEDETRFAACDTEKNLYCFAVDVQTNKFEMLSVAMHLAKTATGLCFTDFPSKNALLVADKFGDVLRFEDGQDFDRWARQSQVNSKALSIHTHKKRSHAQAEEVEEEAEQDESNETEASDANEAHHCTIIGHISMITDVAVLPVAGTEGGLIASCDRDEKVRFTKASSPERIHSFGLAHRQYVASLAACEEICSVFSAGGDNFICQWCIEGEKCILAARIELPRGDVQEIKVSKCGRKLIAWFLGDQICTFEFVEDSWTLQSSTEAKNVTAICFAENEVEVRRCEDSAAFEEASAQISKSKLRKDIERMDWKLKRHEKKQQEQQEQQEEQQDE